MSNARQTPTSAEFALDCEMEALIGKIMAGTAKDGDLARYQQLSIERGRRLHPHAFSRFVELRKARTTARS